MKKNKLPIPNAVDTSTMTVAAITKMSQGGKNEKGSTDIAYTNTTAVSSSIYDKISSNDEILTLFPDVELSIQILVSSILAPNDLLSSKLSYTMEDSNIPSNVNAAILDVIRLHINKYYKLEDKLSTILREALFTKGAYVEALIPGGDVLNIVKSYNKTITTESNDLTVETIQYLGDASDITLTMESLELGESDVVELSINDDDLNVEFTYNISDLTTTSSMELTAEKAYIAKYNKPTFKSFMYNKRVTTDGVVTINTDNTGGAPMSIKLPVGAVLPIHMGTDPSKHMGYLVMLDENGLPISNVSELKRLDKAGSLREQVMDNKASIINKAANALKDKTKKDVILDNTEAIYAKALIAKINNKITTGKLGSSANIPDNSDLYQLTAKRALSGLKTKLLFIPKDNLTYFAFEYRDNGTGKSLLEKSVMLFSIRASNLFTRIMANVKNAVTTTKITANLDERDPDPKATGEMVINETLRSERAKCPIGTMNVTDFLDWMNNVGYRFDIKHPSLPEIDISIEDDNRNIAVPDSGLDEMIQEQIIMSFGLKKDMVMAGYDAEFATTAVANNVLFAKRVMEQQNIFNPQLSGYVSRVLLNDGVLKDKVHNELKNNIASVRRLVKKSLTKDEIIIYENEINDDLTLIEYVYSEYVNTLTITLPKVELSREEGTFDGLSSFSDMLDTYLPMIISSDTLPSDLVGDLSDKMDDVMAAIKTILIKKWVDDRNFLPEITKFLTLDNVGKPKYDILEEYTVFTDALAKAIIPHLKKLKRKSNVINNKLDKIDNSDSVEDDTADNPPAEDQPAGSEDVTPDQPTDDAGGDNTSVIDDTL